MSSPWAESVAARPGRSGPRRGRALPAGVCGQSLQGPEPTVARRRRSRLAVGRTDVGHRKAAVLARRGVCGQRGEHRADHLAARVDQRPAGVPGPHEPRSELIMRSTGPCRRRPRCRSAASRRGAPGSTSKAPSTRVAEDRRRGPRGAVAGERQRGGVQPGHPQHGDVVVGIEGEHGRALRSGPTPPTCTRRVALPRDHVGVGHDEPARRPPSRCPRSRGRRRSRAPGRRRRRGRTPCAQTIRRPGAGTSAAGPASDGSGSMRARALRIGPEAAAAGRARAGSARRGGRCWQRRGAGDCSSTAPAIQAMPSPIAPGQHAPSKPSTVRRPAAAKRRTATRHALEDRWRARRRRSARRRARTVASTASCAPPESISGADPRADQGPADEAGQRQRADDEPAGYPCNASIAASATITRSTTVIGLAA